MKLVIILVKTLSLITLFSSKCISYVFKPETEDLRDKAYQNIPKIRSSR